MRALPRAELEKSVLDFVRNESAKGSFPSYKKVERKFRISAHGIKISEIYFKLGFDILNYPIKRPHRCSDQLKPQLIDYVRSATKGGHFPSRREIESKFGVRLSGLFDGIEDLYSRTGMTYVQKSSQKLKQQKARALLKIVLEDVIPALDLEKVRYSKIHQHGADIVAKNRDGVVVIELKAYNKFEPLKKKDIEQVIRFLNQNRCKKAIIITTTQKMQTSSIPESIRVILFDELLKLAGAKHSKSLDFIRSFSIHRETNEHEQKKQKIIQYVKKKNSKGEDFSCKDILKDLHIDYRTCFKNIYDIYKEAGIAVPPKKIKGIRSKNSNFSTLELKRKIIDYIKLESSKGRYPSGKEIGKHLGISHIWNFFRISDIYRELGIAPYHYRKTRNVIISSP